jgi:predicted Ser/Thr protein kinase
MRKAKRGKNAVMARMQEVLLGRYQLLEVIGRGGMGVVYRAADRVLDRIVAVKVLAVDHAEEPTFVARFEREARAAAALSHRNIVAVYDSGHDGHARFIVMECVAGANLAQLVGQRGPLPAEQAVQIAGQVAGALAAAHRAGIIHRDIKSANVMVDQAGTVKVLDFGIARATGSTSLTQAAILGSAPYIAPEVTRGQRADERSDIYSLGCVLYEMLTGRPPFTGELPAAIMHQHNSAKPRAPRELNRSVPAGLDALVMQMLAKRPADRPQRAAQLTEALPASLRGRMDSPSASQPGASEPTRVLPPRRRFGRVEMIALATASLLVLCGVTLALLASSGSRPERKAVTAHARSAATRTAVKRLPARNLAAAPSTVAGTAAALSTLTSQDVQSGQIDRKAAQALLAGLRGVLGAYDSGNLNDALHHADDLGAHVAQLGVHGDISSRALQAIVAALSRLRATLERAVPPATSVAKKPPAPSHPPPAGRKSPAERQRAPKHTKPGHD